MYTTVDTERNPCRHIAEYAVRMGRKPSLAKRLRRIMEVMEWNQTQLAKAAGCSRQAVSNWLNRGPTQNFSASYAFNLQEKTQFNARWIVEGVGPERIDMLSSDERDFLSRYRNLSADERTALNFFLKP